MALSFTGTAARRWIRTSSECIARLTRLWFDDLLTLVPAVWRERWGRATGQRGPFVVETDASGGYRAAGGSEGALPLETIRARTRARLLVLRIDDAQILRRRLGLPPAAVDQLAAALDMNLSTWTPFGPDEVYASGHPVQDTQPRSGSTAVELRCVPRPLVDAQIDTLRTFGLDPDAIELGDPRFTLLRATRKRLTIQRHRWLVAGLTTLLLAQSTGAYLVLTGRQRDEIEGLEAARAAIVAALRHQSDAEKQALARRDGSHRIAAKMNENLSVSRALSVLAAVLPQEAVLQELEVSRDRAEGHVAILGPASLDVVDALTRTGIYRVRDLSVLPGIDTDRKVFSAGFTVMPWIQDDGRTSR